MTQRTVLLKALASTPGDIARITRSLAVAAAGENPPATQSPLQLINGMSAVEEAYLKWIDRVVAEDHPLLSDDLPTLPTIITGTSMVEATERFQAARATTIERLSGLKPGDWQRAGQRGAVGRITVRGLVDELVARDIELSSRLVELVQLARKATADESVASNG